MAHAGREHAGSQHQNTTRQRQRRDLHRANSRQCRPKRELRLGRHLPGNRLHRRMDSRRHLRGRHQLPQCVHRRTTERENMHHRQRKATHRAGTEPEQGHPPPAPAEMHRGRERMHHHTCHRRQAERHPLAGGTPRTHDRGVRRLLHLRLRHGERESQRPLPAGDRKLQQSLRMHHSPLLWCRLCPRGPLGAGHGARLRRQGAALQSEHVDPLHTGVRRPRHAALLLQCLHPAARHHQPGHQRLLAHRHPYRRAVCGGLPAHDTAHQGDVQGGENTMCDAPLGQPLSLGLH